MCANDLGKHDRWRHATLAGLVWGLTACAPAPATAPSRAAMPSASPEVEIAAQLNLLVDDAERARKAGDAAGERRAYEEIVRLRPRLVEPYLALASVAARQNDAASEEHYLRHALRVAPQDERARFALVASLLRQRRVKEATLEFGATGVGAAAEQAAADDRDPARVALARRLRGAIHLASGRYEEAAREFDQLVKRNPNDPASRIGLAVVKATIGDAPGAERELVQAVALDPRSPIAHYDLALIRLSLKNYPGAIEAAQKAIALDPRLAQAHNALGAALLKQGKPEEAEKAFGEALRIDPKYAAAESNRGVAAYQRGEDREARERFARATQLVPDAPAVHFNLGLAYVRQGEIERARDAFRKASELDPKNVDAARNLRWMEAALRRTARASDLPARDPSISVGELHP